MNEGLTDEQAKAEGVLPEDDDPIYAEGGAVAITLGRWETEPVEPSDDADGKTRYYLIGPDPGTNLFKMVDGIPYILNDDNEWEIRTRMIRFLMGDPETKELTLVEAMEAFARITSGQPWAP